MTKAQHIPDGWPALIPRIFVNTPEPLVAFITNVFGATGSFHRERPSELRIGGSMLMVSASIDREPMPGFLYIYVEDTDATFRRALESGATSIESPQDLPYGDRRAMVRDPWGNIWQIATHSGRFNPYGCGAAISQRTVKTLAFVIGLYVLAVGVVGIVAPSRLIWLAQHFTTPTQWYALAAVRLAVGLLLLSVAKASRAPRTLRVVAFIPLVAALATPVVGVERARATIEWWTMQGSGFVRLSVIPLLALGGVIAYACAPGGHSVGGNSDVQGRRPLHH